MGWRIWAILAGMMVVGWLLGYWVGRRYAKEDVEAVTDELEKSTNDQLEAMRTLSSFRRQYHDGTGALVNEVHKLTRAIERLKKRLDDKSKGPK